jgi:hypothetical protein
MPRKSSQKNRTKARKAKQTATAPKRRQVATIAHHPPTGAALALLAASVLRTNRNEDT